MIQLENVARKEHSDYGSRFPVFHFVSYGLRLLLESLQESPLADIEAAWEQEIEERVAEGWVSLSCVSKL